MRVALMANPASGGGTDVDALRDALRRYGAEIVESDPERIVVAGGDGSIAPAARRAAEIGVPLAVVAVGTANDYARAMGLPFRDHDAAVRVAVTSTRTRSLELGLMDERPFVNVASTGLAPAAARRAIPLKRPLGPLAYSAGAVAAALLERPAHARVVADGEEVHAGGAWQVTVASSGAFGGGSEIRQADPADGRLDLVIVPATPRPKLVGVGLAMRRGRLADLADVVHRRANEIRIEADADYNVDGEVVAVSGSAAFTAHAGAYQLVISEDRPSRGPRRRARGA